MLQVVTEGRSSTWRSICHLSKNIGLNNELAQIRAKSRTQVSRHDVCGEYAVYMMA
jgi:hypothetical protein